MSNARTPDFPKTRKRFSHRKSAYEKRNRAQAPPPLHRDLRAAPPRSFSPTGFSLWCDRGKPDVVLDFNFSRILAIRPVAGVAGHEHFFADDDRAGHTGTGKSDLPLQIFCLTESRWKRIRIRRNSRPVRPTKTIPVRSLDAAGSGNTPKSKIADSETESATEFG